MEQFEIDASWRTLWFEGEIAESQASWSHCQRMLERHHEAWIDYSSSVHTS
jgi:hypothetical protein